MVNLTFPMASSSDAAIVRCRGMESHSSVSDVDTRLLCESGSLGCSVGCKVASLSFFSMCRSVCGSQKIRQHRIHTREASVHATIQSLQDTCSACLNALRCFPKLTVLPALSSPRNRIFAFLLTEKAQRRKAQSSQHIPVKLSSMATCCVRFSCANVALLAAITAASTTT